MYLDHIHEFSDFLAMKEHKLTDILDHLVRVTLASQDVTSVIYYQANELNEFLTVGESGVSSSAEAELEQSYSLDEKYPVADAIRQGKFVFLPHSSESLERYPVLANFPELIGNKTLFVVPIFSSGTPTAAMAIFSKSSLENTTEFQSFVSAMSSLFSLYFYRNIVALPGNSKQQNHSSEKLSIENSSELTERQNVILRLISEDRTNRSISEFLGYSESTIRQEIIRIFAKLGCSSRNQAAEIFRGWNRD